jgi:hypothetical protein
MVVLLRSRTTSVQFRAVLLLSHRKLKISIKWNEKLVHKSTLHCTPYPTQEMPLPIEHIGAQVHRLLLQLQIQLKIILFKVTAVRD